MLLHNPLNPATGVEDAAMLPWVAGNPSTGVEGSYPSLGVFTDPQQEIVNAITASGLTPSSDLTQLSQAIARLIANAISGIHIPTVPTYAGVSGVKISGTTASLDIASLPTTTSCVTGDTLPILRNGTDEQISVQALAAEILSLATSGGGSVAPQPPNLILFGSSGNYTPTAGARAIFVWGVAGGGGGATAGNNNSPSTGGKACGGGGGGGGGFFLRLDAASVGTVSVTIGSGGGVPPAGQGAHGYAGGATSFGAFATGFGGYGGLNAGTIGLDTTRGAGGAGGGAQVASGVNGYPITGQPGQCAADDNGGAGGSSFFGGGGWGGDDVAANSGYGAGVIGPRGAAGTGDGGAGSIGAGGGGSDWGGNSGDTAGAAGVGGGGFVQIWEFF